MSAPWTLERIREAVTVSDTGCWEWTASHYGNGYGRAYRDGKMTATHRLAFELANGPIPEGLYILHRCDVRACCNPEHLFAGTASENTRDMYSKGRQGTFRLKREASPQAKLTEQKARDIRSSALPGAALAAKHGVSLSLIYQVRRGERWGAVA